jgi:carboxyl-terminal processing protease
VRSRAATHSTRSTLLAAVAAGGLGLLIQGCAGSSATTTTPSPGVADCSVAGQNAQVLSIMRSWYYWDTTLPATVDTASYPTTDALLNALREQPLDRFTYFTTQAADQSFYGAGQYVGYGLGFDLTAANDLLVDDVYAGSPAAGAGLARGDTITGINGWMPSLEPRAPESRRPSPTPTCRVAPGPPRSSRPW